MFQLLLIQCLLFASFIGKPTDGNEYEKWMDFHNLTQIEFPKRNTEEKRTINWSDYNLTTELHELFKPFRIYSPDSTYFIDLDSYSLVLEEKDGTLISYGSEVDTNVQIIDVIENKVGTLLFCGTACFPETAIWTNNEIVQILGFSVIENEHFPPIWTFDLKEKLFTENRAVKALEAEPESYSKKVRLKSINFKY